MNGPWLSVIIPVYREAGAIGSCLGLLSRCRRIERAEVIVVDGDNGSTRTPRDIMPVKVVSSAPGRGVQLNAGRRAAAADRLLFLHVDTALPVNFVDLVCRALKRYPAGAFDLHIVTRNPVTALIGLAGRIRSRINRVPYGDQAQFIRTDVFDVVGGFPDEPLMEDVALMDRLKAAGHRITFLTPPARTSDRRWRAEGAVRGTLRNWRLLIAYRAGVPPSQLVLRYKPRPSDPGQLERRGARPDRTARGTGDMDRVIVFYRSLQPGRVKTRLAAAVGDQAAVAVYRAMVEDLVSELRDLWPNVVPYIDETGGEDLFGAGRPQTGSTLEERMDSAFSEVFAAGADRAVLVGSDIPGLHAGIIRDAFSVLDTNDAVVGPALNGGYYLIGYRRGERRPALSRTTVRPGGGDLRNPFESVVQLLRSSGVSWGELGPLRDVDTVEDLELVLRSVADPRGRLHAAVLRHLPGLLPGH